MRNSPEVMVTSIAHNLFFPPKSKHSLRCTFVLYFLAEKYVQPFIYLFIV